MASWGRAGCVVAQTGRRGHALRQFLPERADTALERELESVLVEPLVIVFDDAEAVAETPAALGVIGRLLVTDSGQLRVAFATHQRLTLRLARLRAMGRITELGASEL